MYMYKNANSIQDMAISIKFWVPASGKVFSIQLCHKICHSLAVSWWFNVIWLLLRCDLTSGFSFNVIWHLASPSMWSDIWLLLQYVIALWTILAQSKLMMVFISCYFKCLNIYNS
jgi:hypothetical protein